MDKTLRTRVTSTLTNPFNLGEAESLLYYMRRSLRMNYFQCEAAIEEVVPGVDFEDLSAILDDYASGKSRVETATLPKRD